MVELVVLDFLVLGVEQKQVQQQLVAVEMVADIFLVAVAVQRLP